jgi:hypothetical protein
MSGSQNAAHEGWNIGDPEKFIADYNRRAYLLNFPPDKKVEIEGTMFEGGRTSGSDLVAIGGRDHKGGEWKVCMDLPNAMYLMNLLHQIWKSTKAPVPLEAPNGCMRRK